MLKNILLFYKKNSIKCFFRFFIFFWGKYLHIKNISPTFVIVKDGSCETSLL